MFGSQVVDRAEAGHRHCPKPKSAVVHSPFPSLQRFDERSRVRGRIATAEAILWICGSEIKNLDFVAKTQKKFDWCPVTSIERKTMQNR
jgi:hypothetical protein